MADKKISALTGASTPLAGTEVLPIVQGGVTVKVSAADITAGRNVSMLNATIGAGGSAAIGTGVVLEGTSNAGNGAFIQGKRGGSGAWLTGDYASAFGSGDGYLVFAYSTNPIVFHSQSNGELLRLTGTNVQVTTGNLVIGTAGKGIDFSANSNLPGMTSELLNDYEEGNWTPVGNGITYAAGTAGKYTKIGNLVICTFTVVFPTTANGSNAQIQGLPLASSVNSAATFGVYTSGFNGPLDAGNSYIGFINETGTAFIANATLSAKTITGSITYQV